MKQKFLKNLLLMGILCGSTAQMHAAMGWLQYGLSGLRRVTDYFFSFNVPFTNQQVGLGSAACVAVPAGAAAYITYKCLPDRTKRSLKGYAVVGGAAVAAGAVAYSYKDIVANMFTKADAAAMEKRQNDHVSAEVSRSENALRIDIRNAAQQAGDAVRASEIRLGASFGAQLNAQADRVAERLKGLEITYRQESAVSQQQLRDIQREFGLLPAQVQKELYAQIRPDIAQVMQQQDKLAQEQVALRKQFDVVAQAQAQSTVAAAAHAKESKEAAARLQLLIGQQDGKVTAIGQQVGQLQGAIDDLVTGQQHDRSEAAKNHSQLLSLGRSILASQQRLTVCCAAATLINSHNYGGRQAQVRQQYALRV
jgi:hypothetical protein